MAPNTCHLVQADGRVHVFLRVALFGFQREAKGKQKIMGPFPQNDTQPNVATGPAPSRCHVRPGLHARRYGSRARLASLRDREIARSGGEQ